MNQLYRHFDEGGKLLYVGISLSAMNRLSQHKLHSHWYKRIKNVTIENFTTREDVLIAEKLAVKSESPECNINLRQTEKEIAQENIRQEYLIRHEAAKNRLLSRVVNFDVCYGIDDISRILAMTKNEIQEYIDKGIISTFKVLSKKSGKWDQKMITKISGFAFIDFIEYLESKK